MRVVGVADYNAHKKYDGLDKLHFYHNDSRDFQVGKWYAFAPVLIYKCSLVGILSTLWHVTSISNQLNCDSYLYDKWKGRVQNNQ